MNKFFYIAFFTWTYVYTKCKALWHHLFNLKDNLCLLEGECIQLLLTYYKIKLRFLNRSIFPINLVSLSPVDISKKKQKTNEAFVLIVHVYLPALPHHENLCLQTLFHNTEEVLSIYKTSPRNSTRV